MQLGGILSGVALFHKMKNSIFFAFFFFFSSPVFAFNCLNTNPSTGNVQNMNLYSNYASPLACTGGDLSGFRSTDMVIYNTNLADVAALKSQVVALQSQVLALSGASSVPASATATEYNPAAFTSGVEFGAAAAGLMLTAWGFVAIRRVLLP